MLYKHLRPACATPCKALRLWKKRSQNPQRPQATFERILENAPLMFNAAQLRLFLRALCNLDPYTITDDVAEHFARDNENNQQAAEEILASALAETPDEKLTSFALRLALTGYVYIPRESEFDFLAEVESAFTKPKPQAEKKPKKAPTPIKTAAKKTARKEEDRGLNEKAGFNQRGRAYAAPF